MSKNVEFVLMNKEAVLPTKGTDFSVGYDLTAIRLSKKINSVTWLYNTGLMVKPPDGYYLEILPRSSLIKTGYMLANSVGIIDSDYRGELLIALNKVDDTVPHLQTPFTKCQLVLRKYENYTVTQVEKLDDTERGAGGFGSTDKK
jgi:dUTP pyrophosphatase